MDNHLLVPGGAFANLLISACLDTKVCVFFFFFLLWPEWSAARSILETLGPARGEMTSLRL
jgi:hypothetical protein